MATASGARPSTALAIRLAIAVTFAAEICDALFKRRTTVALEGCFASRNTESFANVI
jgi:hypothetical protein